MAGRLDMPQLGNSPNDSPDEMNSDVQDQEYGTNNEGQTKIDSLEVEELDVVVPGDLEMEKLIMETMGVNGSWNEILGFQNDIQTSIGPVLDMPEKASGDSPDGDQEVEY